MCRAGPDPGELFGDASAPYSQAYFEVSGNVFAKVPFTYTLIDESAHRRPTSPASRTG